MASIRTIRKAKYHRNSWRFDIEWHPQDRNRLYTNIIDDYNKSPRYWSMRRRCPYALRLKNTFRYSMAYSTDGLQQEEIREFMRVHHSGWWWMPLEDFDLFNTTIYCQNADDIIMLKLRYSDYISNKSVT